MSAPQAGWLALRLARDEGKAPLLLPPPDFPLIEDPRSLQIALNQVMQGLLRGSIDEHTAGQVLCGLQMAVGQVKGQK